MMIQSCVSKETSNFPCISWKRFAELGLKFPTILTPATDQPCSPGLPSSPPSLPTSHSLFPVRPLSDWSERKERLKETGAIAEGSHSCRSVCEKVFTRHFIEQEIFNEYDVASLRYTIKALLVNVTEIGYTQQVISILFSADNKTI